MRREETQSEVFVRLLGACRAGLGELRSTCSNYRTVVQPNALAKDDLPGTGTWEKVHPQPRNVGNY